jgi:hypothetical protein
MRSSNCSSGAAPSAVPGGLTNSGAEPSRRIAGGLWPARAHYDRADSGSITA